MGKYLITGRSGVGKSTICLELQRQSHPTFDGDQVKGLAGWVNPQTGSPIVVNLSNPIDPTRQAWQWNKAVLRELLTRHDDLFLCGSAHNQLEFHELFDTVFVLALPAEIQRQRILGRTEDDYGKHPEMQSRILAEQVEFVKQATELGAKTVDATKTPSEIVQDILADIHAH